jgi:hypothetical protein
LPSQQTDNPVNAFAGLTEIGSSMGHSVDFVLDFELAAFDIGDAHQIGRWSGLFQMEFLLECSVSGSKSFYMGLNAHSPTPHS